MSTQKRKGRIPTRAEIQDQGPVKLDMAMLAEDDRTLPKPLGATGPTKDERPSELAKLARTRRAGGLVDDNATIRATPRYTPHIPEWLKRLKRGQEEDNDGRP